MIQTLPTELIEHVCDELRVHRDLLALALCCRLLHALITEDHLIYRRVQTGMNADNLRLRPVWQHFVENPTHARRVSEVHLNGRTDTRDSLIVTRLVEDGVGITRIARGQQHDFFLHAIPPMSRLISFVLDDLNHLGASRTNQLWRLLGANCPQLHRLRIMHISPAFTEDLPHIKNLRSVYIRFNHNGPHAWEGMPHDKLLQFLRSQSDLERLSLESHPGDYSLSHHLLRSARWPKLTHLQLRLEFSIVDRSHLKDFIVAHGSMLQVLEYRTQRLRPLPEGSLPVLHTLILGDYTDRSLVYISHACPPCLVEIRGLGDRRQITGGGKGRTTYKREGLANVRRVYARLYNGVGDLEPLLGKTARAFDQEVEVYVPEESPRSVGWRRFTTSEILDMEPPVESDSN